MGRSPCEVPVPAASVSPGNQLEMQVIGSLHPYDIRKLRVGLSDGEFIEPSGWVWHMLPFENLYSTSEIIFFLQRAR